MRTTAHRVAAELVKALADNGLRDAVVSPGSRNAPLVIALYHEPRIRLTVAIDERSAAHIALGMALATRRPAAAVSTSGTAAVNHGPALAEAFHARVPLLSLTADRPVASRDRGHGQTARQAHLFAPHVLLSLDLDEHDPSAAAEAARRAMASSAHGPVHINIPLSEPLYGVVENGYGCAAQNENENARLAPLNENARLAPLNENVCGCAAQNEVDTTAPPSTSTSTSSSTSTSPSTSSSTSPSPPNPLLSFCDGSGAGVLVVIGALPPRLTPRLAPRHAPQHAPQDVLRGVPGDAGIGERLGRVAGVVAEVWSGVVGEGVEASADRWMAAWGTELEGAGGRPDVVVTAGGPLMSKAMRLAISGWGVPHVHIGADGPACDVFGTLVGHWEVEAWRGLEELAELLEPDGRYAGEWGVARLQVERAHREAVEAAGWCDLRAVALLAGVVGEGEVVHVGNSTAARYVQLFGWKAERVHANRGVAGIDGCVSTAVGDALACPEQLVWLLIGDVAMLYDANGLLVKPMPSNLRIVVINNGGGNIFRWLPGPAEVGLLEDYFEAGTGRSFESVAALHGLEYLRAADEQECAAAMEQLRTLGRPGVLEVVTDGEVSAAEYTAYVARLARLGGALHQKT